MSTACLPEVKETVIVEKVYQTPSVVQKISERRRQGDRNITGISDDTGYNGSRPNSQPNFQSDSTDDGSSSDCSLQIADERESISSAGTFLYEDPLSKPSVASLPPLPVGPSGRRARGKQWSSEPNPDSILETINPSTYRSSSNDSVSSEKNPNEPRSKRKGYAIRPRPDELDLARPSTLSKESQNRIAILREVVDTEQNYVKYLRILLDRFIKPLKRQRLCTQQEISQIFCNIDEIYTEHSGFVKKLEEIQSFIEHQDNASIGDVIYSFAQRTSLHQAYIKFMTNYASNESGWKDVASRQAVDDFLTEEYANLSRETPPMKQRVEDMLGTIRDRFYKYKMFTERLVKDTPEYHDDHKEILKAEREIGVILTRLDREVKIAQKTARNLILVSLIEKAFEDDFSTSGINEETRNLKYLCYDPITIQTSKNKGVYYLWLFNNMLVISQMSTKQSKLKVPPEVQQEFPEVDLSHKYKGNNYFLLQDTSLKEASQSQDTDDKLDRARKEIEILDNAIDILDKATRSEILNKRLELEKLKKDLDKEFRDLSIQHNTSLEIEVNTATNGLETIPIEFQSLDPQKRYDFKKLFDAAKKESIGCRSAGPRMSHCLPLQKSRNGQDPSAAISVNGKLWVLSTSERQNSQICILNESKESSPHYEICDAQVNTMCHVTSSSRVRDRRFRELESRAYRDDSDSDESDCGIPLSLAGGGQFVPDDCVWLGTDDNRVLIFETEEDAKKKTPRATIKLDAPVLCILVHEEHVIISIGTTDSSAALCIFSRVSAGWKIDEWRTLSVAKDLCDGERKEEFLNMLYSGFSKMIIVEGVDGFKNEIWAASGPFIFILDSENNYKIRKVFDAKKSETPGSRPLQITAMASSHGTVYIAVDEKCKLFVLEAGTRAALDPIDLDSHVNRQLNAFSTGKDDIIRQHKKNRLRIMCLLMTQNYLWVGTSAGVVLNIEIHAGRAATHNNQQLIQALSHGHTGRVLVLAALEVDKSKMRMTHENRRRMSATATQKKVYLVSAGEGLENFTQNSCDAIGKHDATQHLIYWRCR
ncbi:Oidioi.mRNA.OKI2018_I69.chr2.g5363.t1.cds [Oikopleura dioica]|uniref:Oidioi.mRNA.OKI2018_I69.chr2.g5363.t1.cds n=1 Tax=Oikopleura dioica TaxID=34765 RepID=A0ABN7T6R8_OIKDI|nr:Oidioi.mRNA.OKI2018_I69.chr2.g5363.t1.cds [Oikopleura dioica]